MAGAVQRAVKKWRITHLEKYKAQNRKNSITLLNGVEFPQSLGEY